MSIQNIIDKAQQLEIDRRRMVGQTISRSQRIKTSERNTVQPWKFKVTPPASLDWASSRGFMEVIDLNDRVNEYTISLNNNPGMNYITAYQGGLRQSQLDALTISSTGTSTIVLTGLPNIGTTTTNTTTFVSSLTVLLAKGDFIQPANSRYPYTVTADVLRGSNTTTSVSLNRSILTSEGVNLVGQAVKIGNACTWRVIVTGMPTYTLIPMRRVQYTGDFELVEKVI
jgi:hypothetical protein